MCKYLYYCSIIKCKSLLLLMSDTTISAGLHWLCPEKPDSDQISHIFVSIVSLTDNLLTFYLNSDPHNHWCKPDLFSQMLLPAEHIYFYHTPAHPDQTCLGLSVEYVWNMFFCSSWSVWLLFICSSHLPEMASSLPVTEIPLPTLKVLLNQSFLASQIG